MSERDFCSVVKGGKSEFKTNRFQSGDDFILESVCGVSCASKDALAANPQDGTVAFAATSVLVFLDPRYSKQTFLENPSGKSIRAVAFSDDAKYVAFGETGYNPNVYIYNHTDRRLLCVIGLKTMCTVKALEFHPRSIYLAVACANSYNIGLFDLKGRKLASATFVVEPLGMTLPKVGSYLVVCGHRKLSLFSLTEVDTNLDMQMYPTNIVFDRRSVLLGYQSDYTFVDVTSGVVPHERRVYTVTSCGYLCDLKVGDIFIDRAYKIDMQCFCVRYCFGCIFVGCSKNTISICSPVNLSVITTIQDRDVFSPLQAQPSIWKFEANAVSLAANRSTKIVTCIFSDHHRHSWQVRLIKDSIECNAIIPVDANGNKVAWKPTSYEMQSKVGNVLSYYGSQKSRISPREGLESLSGLPDAFRLTGPGYKPLTRPSATPCYVNATRFTPDGKKIICGNAEGEIKIFDALTGRLIRVIEAHSSTVTHIELLFDDQFMLVASGGRDRVIFILDAHKEYGLVQVLCDHSSAIVSISMANYSDTLTLVSSAADGVILIRRAIKGRQLRFVIIGELSEFGGKPRMYAHGNDFIITGGDNGQINLFQTDPFISTKPTRTIKSGACTKGKRFMKAVTLDPSGCYIATNSATGILVFNIHTGKHVATLSKMKDVSLAVFTNDCKYLVCESNDGCRFQWQLPKRMSEVMKAKLGDHKNCGQRDIPYQKILSRMNLKETASPPNEEATQDSPADIKNVRDAVHVSKFLFHKEVKTVGPVLHKSPSECDSYSTCNSSSRSYTDLTDLSRQRNNIPSDKYGQRSMEISDEARHLLYFENAVSESSTCASDDKTAESYTPTRNSADKSRLTQQSTDLDETQELSLLQDSDKSILTKPNAIKSGLENTTPTARVALATTERKYNPQKDTQGCQLRSRDLRAIKKNDVKIGVHEMQKIKKSPNSEYYSAGSDQESVRAIDFHSEGLHQDQQALNTDSMTVQPSDLISKLHQFLVPVTNVIELNSDGNPSADVNVPEPVLRSDCYTKESDFFSSFNKHNSFEAHEERYDKKIIGEKDAKSNWRDDSPGRSLRKKEYVSPEKDGQTLSATFREKMEIFKAKMTAQFGKPEGDITLKSQGEYEEKKEISEEMEERKHDKGDKGDFHSPYTSGELQNINQNTDSTVEYDNIDNGSSKQIDKYCFVEDPLDMSVTVCLGRSKSGKSKKMAKKLGGVKATEMPEEESMSGVLSPGSGRQLTPLSNTQETFFNFHSDLLDNDFIQDLAPVDSVFWRSQTFPEKGWKWIRHEAPPLISGDGEKSIHHNRTMQKRCRHNASEEKKEDEKSVSCVDGESTKTDASLNAEKTGADCIHLDAVEDKDQICFHLFDKQPAEVSQSLEVQNLTSKINEIGTESTDCQENHGFSEKCPREIQNDNVEMRRLSSDSVHTPVGKESDQNHLGEICQKAESATNNSLEANKATAEMEFQDQTKHHAHTASRRTVSPIALNGSLQERYTEEKEEEEEVEEEEEEEEEEEGEEGCLNRVSSAGLRSPDEDSSGSTITFQEGTTGCNTEFAKAPGDAPPSPNKSGRRSSQGIIDGLGSVANLYRNKHDYVRRLREARHNFELSIQALKDDKRKQQQRSQKQTKHE